MLSLTPSSYLHVGNDGLDDPPVPRLVVGLHRLDAAHTTSRTDTTTERGARLYFGIITKHHCSREVQRHRSLLADRGSARPRAQRVTITAEFDHLSSIRVRRRMGTQLEHPDLRRSACIHPLDGQRRDKDSEFWATYGEHFRRWVAEAMDEL